MINSYLGNSLKKEADGNFIHMDKYMAKHEIYKDREILQFLGCPKFHKTFTTYGILKDSILWNEEALIHKIFFYQKSDMFLIVRLLNDPVSNNCNTVNDFNLESMIFFKTETYNHVAKKKIFPMYSYKPK